MNQAQLFHRTRYAHAARGLVLASSLASVLLLSACSSTPNWANPVEWYKGATSVFDSDKEPSPPAKTEEAEELRNRPVPGAGEPFPNLASVPERPKSVTPAAERKRITESLVADRDNARYVDPPAPRPVVVTPRPAVRSETPATATATPAASPPQAPSAPPPAAPPAAAPVEPPPPPPAAAVAPRPTQQAQAPSVSAVPRPRVADTQPTPPPPATAAPPEIVAANPLPAAPRLNGPGPDAVVLFNDGSSQLSAEQRRGLSAVVRDAKARNSTVRVVGRSPLPKNQSQASLLASFNTSWNRAHAVADALTRLGIPASQIRVEAETSPDAAPTVASVPRGDAGMRRADIYLE